VGIYQDTDGIWSDLYESVSKCHRVDGRRRCAQVLRRYGDIHDLGTGSFTVASDLSEAHLEATYRLQTWRGHHLQRGRTTWSTSTDFEGTGELEKFASSESYSTDCFTYRYRSHGVSRTGEAIGTLTGPDGVTRDLGETYSAWGQTGKRFSFSRTCDDE
jgi:hypothetical protein